MQLGRYQVSTLRPPPILDVSFSADGRAFAVATETGFEVWRTWPLGLLRRRGTLARAVPIPQSALLVLQGGGSNPLFPPNKAVIYHDQLGQPVAELEFGEQIRGIVTRYRLIVIVLLRRVIAYEFGYGGDTPKGVAADAGTSGSFWVSKLGDWETAENEHGLTSVSTAPGSTLLALPGRQAGHVQLVHLPPCGTPEGKAKTVTASFRTPILLAHTHPLSSLTCSATGSHILTASERGTLLRVWDTARGSLEKELRRGVDPAEIWGLRFEDDVFVDSEMLGDAERARELARRKGGRVAGWSDKGTVHVWGDTAPAAPKAQASLAKTLGKALALPNYFSSMASTAQYFVPRKNPHAFSGAIGAAADAAGLPSMKIGEDDREPQEREWAERYVVGWIEVDPEPEPERERPDRPAPARKAAGIGMGTREERHSYGSDATSTRTATPSGRRAATPTQSAYTGGRRDSGSARGSNRSSSQSRAPRVTVQRKDSGSSRPVPADAKPGPPKKERQLVVVTFAGDWYRLRLPHVAQVDDGDEAKTRCELVEYRRLGVGGGGW